MRSDGGSLLDQSLLFALGDQKLVYHSAPFAEDMEISGFFRLAAWIAIDCPDADIYVSVHEIMLDGTSLRLSTDALRVRYRESPRSQTLADPGVPFFYLFDRFTFVSRLVRRGHRLRLVIAPLGRLIETTFVQRNVGSGGTVARECTEDARPIQVSVFHQTARQTVLQFPIGATSTDGSR